MRIQGHEKNYNLVASVWTWNILNKNLKMYLSFDKIIRGLKLLSLKEIRVFFSMIHGCPALPDCEKFDYSHFLYESMHHKPPAIK
jgi:hypothetical protein